MEANDLRRIRSKAGLSLDGLAKVLRLSDRSTVHRWEKGSRAVSGPASIILEMIERGELPERYLNTPDVTDYTSDRVFDGVRHLDADAADRHRTRLLNALEKSSIRKDKKAP